MNVLLVDDEVIVINILKNKMKWQEIGIENVYTAYTAAEARKVIQSQEIDIIVCDIEMPQENGLQLMKWIQEEKMEIERIVLTGFPDFNYAQNAISSGVIRYLVKPVSFEELEEAIRFAMGKKKEYQMKKIEVSYSRRERERQFYTGLLIENILPYDNYIREAAGEIELETENLDVFGMIYLKLSEMPYDIASYSIVVHALGNVAEELFPDVVEIHVGHLVFWILRSERDRDHIREMCSLFMEKMAGNFKGEIDAYYTIDVSLNTISEKSRVLQMAPEQHWKVGEHIYDVDAMLAHLADEEKQSVGSGQETVQMVKDYIREHYQEQITRQDMEENIHLNSDYVNRIFKRSTGYSLVQYLQYYRVLMAKKLFTEQKGTVTEVGLQVGFDTPSYFAKVFKKWTGFTPLEYYNQKSKDR